MPAQGTSSSTAYYQEGDTYPPLRRRLLDGDGEPVNLDGATVTITIGHASYDYYYSPMTKIVVDGACIVETPQADPDVTGWVQWEPQVGDLSVPGAMHYRFKVVHSGGGIQHFPPIGYETLQITTPVGGVL